MGVQYGKSAFLYFYPFGTEALLEADASFEQALEAVVERQRDC